MSGTALVVILDLNPVAWASPSFGIGLADNLTKLLFTIHAHLQLSAANRVAVIAADGCRSQLLFPPPGTQPNAPFDVAQQQIVQQILAFAGETEAAAAPEGSSRSAAEGCKMASAMSHALCYLQRLISESPLSPPRGHVLALSVSADTPAQYVSVMNAIFAAVKMSVTFDAVALGTSDSSFLQQAAHLTGGIYSRAASAEVLAQYFLTVCLCPPALRGPFAVPPPCIVEFKASCFCHRQSVALGHVCSACLSIFCEPLPKCSTCGSVFAAKSEQQLAG